MAIVQVQGTPTVPTPPTLFVLVAVRSGPARTRSLQALLPSFDSATSPFGSAWQLPPVRGLAKAPGAVAVAVTATWKLLAGGIETAAPVAAHASLTVKSMVQV